MARRKQQSALDELFEFLKIAPAWFGPAFAVFVFVVLRFLVPIFLSPPKPGKLDFGGVFRQIMPTLSWMIAGVVLMVWVIAELWKLFNRNLLDNQTGAASIRNLNWKEFERLVSEAYRRRGYLVEVVGSSSGDGGIDVRLTRPGETVLVQCKHWKAFNVDVTKARELLGVVTAERATRGILVTSGQFTREAMRFAAENSAIELVDGSALFELIRGVQADPVTPSTSKPARPIPAPVWSTTAPQCPACGTGMVVRTARNGNNAGSNFWGCPRYPACRGTRPI